eukprot:gnl/TRDRNA2_/TRDRNA2_189867_c0_seq1.p1 gnl/TRDRNA2_/TRDRNA2_189867_c0~~gnl/TRDRNA2_/TRDRNA2_189867_c0_seq1.p1  ORF type:complete len:465 (+),score=71.61 gnl/TRDRNA2_/TRDRNA2_189867_c0_seq1:36-1397(+)
MLGARAGSGRHAVQGQRKSRPGTEPAGPRRWQTKHEVVQPPPSPVAPRARPSRSHSRPGRGGPAAHRLETQPIPILVHQATWGEEELAALHDVAKDGDYVSHGYWLEYFPGDGAVVIACPHDGTMRPPGLPRRTFGVMVRDTGTRGLAAALALEVVRRGASRPHVLICHLVRNRCDVNRPKDQAACHPAALRFWDQYHQLLNAACAAAALAAPGRALFLDVHAQANYRFSGVDALELGTLCPSAEELRRGATHLESLATERVQVARLEASVHSEDVGDCLVSHLQGLFTMPRLASAVLLGGGSFADLLRGQSSLGGLLGKRGYKAVPSPALPVPPPTIGGPGYCCSQQCRHDTSGDAAVRAESAPAEPGGDGENEDEDFDGEVSHFFCGSSSYTLQECHAVLDSVQAECPVRLTKDPEAWASMARAIMGALEELWRVHLNHDLCAAANRGQRG